jgi:thioredoxin reductase (NADPH)
MLKQAKSFGADVLSYADVRSVELQGELKRVEVDDEGVFYAPAIILAPGGTPRKLGAPGETELQGKGISYCATCDGDFFTGKSIVVIGGGNSALEEAVSLTRYASKVTVLHVLGEYQAQPWALEAARKNPKVELFKLHRVVSFQGKESLERVVTENLETGESVTFEADGAFVFIGYQPNTTELQGVIAMNDRGEIVADENLKTNVSGVYVAGDAREKRYRQITTAVADGTIAALAAADFVFDQRAKTEVGVLRPYVAGL